MGPAVHATPTLAARQMHAPHPRTLCIHTYVQQHTVPMEKVCRADQEGILREIKFFFFFF